MLLNHLESQINHCFHSGIGLILKYLKHHLL